MATRGAKPKAAHLRLVDGTHRATRHGSAKKAKAKVESAIAVFGQIEQPDFLAGDALTAWQRYIKPAGWLDGSREPAAIAFCALWSQFRGDPAEFPAAKHGQLRAYMSELGLTDERNRGDVDDGKDEDEFFGD